jgi:hypothetical protein
VEWIDTLDNELIYDIGADMDGAAGMKGVAEMGGTAEMKVLRRWMM